MGVEKLDIWTCDRCGAELKFPSNSANQPVGWVGVDVYYPPKSGEAKGVRRILCAECDTVRRDAMAKVS